MPQKAIAALDISNDTVQLDNKQHVLVAIQVNYMIPTVKQILEVDRPKPDALKTTVVEILDLLHSNNLTSLERNKLVTMCNTPAAFLQHVINVENIAKVMHTISETQSYSRRNVQCAWERCVHILNCMQKYNALCEYVVTTEINGIGEPVVLWNRWYNNSRMTSKQSLQELRQVAANLWIRLMNWEFYFN